MPLELLQDFLGDIFWGTGVLTAALVVLVLLMKRSVAEKGEHIRGE